MKWENRAGKAAFDGRRNGRAWLSQGGNLRWLSLGTFPNSEDRKTESRKQAFDIYIVLRQENSASLNSFHLKNNTSSIQVLILLRERDHIKFQKKI